MRLHFTAADLCKITLAAPDALQETTFSVRRLRLGPAGGHGFRPGLGQWHRRMRAGGAAQAGILADLIPRGRLLPDFLFHLADDFATAVTRAAQTPTSQLAGEIGQLPNLTPTNRRLRELAEGTPAARRDLARDLHRYFDNCLADLWPQVRAGAAADRALRSEALLRGGVDGLLATLVTNWRWEPPVLHIPWPGIRDVDVPLCGRGLVLLPSYFAGPGLMYRAEEPSVLIYPMCAAEPSVGAADALGALLGRTRAAVLAAVRHPATTTTVAERADISLPSASQHATVLRNAGLITTTRTGSAVLHTLTPLGDALLRGETITR